MRTAEAGLLTVMKLPDDGPRYELIEGELLMAPAPNRYHRTVSFNLTLILCDHLRKKCTGKICTAPFDVVFDEPNVLQPDILFFFNARSSALTKTGASGAPNLPIEIISPGAEKLARTGVEKLWLIPPDRRRMEIYRWPENPDRPADVAGAAERFESKLFPGLTTKGAEVFAD